MLVSRSVVGLMGVVSNRGDEVVACVGAGSSVKRGEVLVERIQNAEWVGAAYGSRVPISALFTGWDVRFVYL